MTKTIILTKNNLHMIGVDKNSTEVTIPHKFSYDGEDYKISIVGQKLFDGDTVLEKVIIEEGIHTIRKNAFSYCQKLNSIKLPHSLKVLESEVF